MAIASGHKFVIIYIQTLVGELIMGEYFADYDEDSGMCCVFHTDLKSGFAYSSWLSMEDAKTDADKRNREVCNASH